MRKWSVLVAALAGLAGCGSSTPSSSSEVSSVVHRYYQAVADGDGTTACSLLTAAAKVRFESSHNRLFAGLSCAAKIEAVHRFLNAEELSLLRGATVGSTRVSGQAASASVTSGGHSTTIVLAKTSDGWQLDSIGGALGTASSPPASSGSSIEGVAGLERQLAAGEVASATVNRRIRLVHLTLHGGRRVLAHYGKGEEPQVVAALASRHVPITIMSPEAARDEAAQLHREP